MIEHFGTEPWRQFRRHSIISASVAFGILVSIVAVVYFGKLYRAEGAFVIGFLVGAIAYWTALECLHAVHARRFCPVSWGVAKK